MITNLRGVTLTRETYTSKGEVLCSRCQNIICENYAAQICREFVPPIKFSKSAKGLDLPRFNTFRIGEAWHKRLYVGKQVALVKEDEIVSMAIVEALHIGEKEEMAENFAHENHSIIALDVKENIPEVMLKRLRNTSGKLFYDMSKLITVIYLRPV